ncbi:MAG TPA: hypothetical protein VK207_12070 [Bacteroidales bacterium]|nr:hypothetical protein [Bacteroidales bacterium]
MKRIFLLSVFVLLIISCKKTEFSPEGPTDIRIRNLSDMSFTEVTIKTSEYEEDVANIPSIPSQGTSEYQRFKKAYPKAEISAKVYSGGSLITVSTGKVDFTYMQYLSTQRVTFEVYIPNLQSKVLEISRVIPEEELVLK